MYTIIPLSISIRYTLPTVCKNYIYQTPSYLKRSYTNSSLDETINPHPNPNFYQAGYESLFFKEIGRKIRGTRLCTRKPPRYGAHQIDTNKNPSPFTQNKRRGGMRNAQCNAMHTWNIVGTNFQVLFGRENDPQKCWGGVHLRGMWLEDTPSRIREFVWVAVFFHRPVEMGPPIKPIFESRTFFVTTVSRSFRVLSSLFSFPFSLSLALTLKAHSFLCFACFFILYIYIFFFLFCSPLLLTRSPSASLVILLRSRVLFYTVTNHVRPLTRVAEYCSGLKEEKKNGILRWIMWRGFFCSTIVSFTSIIHLFQH